jgi:hypothetical protein
LSFNGRVGSTVDSHRLLELALRQGGPALQDALVERLFDDYFIQGLPLSDRSVLLKAAAAAKVEGAEALLDDPDQLAEDVFSEVSEAAMGGCVMQKTRGAARCTLAACWLRPVRTSAMRRRVGRFLGGLPPPPSDANPMPPFSSFS